MAAKIITFPLDRLFKKRETLKEIEKTGYALAQAKTPAICDTSIAPYPTWVSWLTTYPYQEETKE